MSVAIQFRLAGCVQCTQLIVYNRYLPESMLIERGLKSDTQVAETAKLLRNTKQFDKVLARDKSMQDGSYKTASASKPIMSQE